MRQLFLKKTLTLFVLIFSLFLVNSCEKNQNTLIDSISDAPFLASVSFSLNIIATDTIYVDGDRKPGDLITIRGLATAKIKHYTTKEETISVRGSVIKTPSSLPNGEGSLHDDGIPPDGVANDSIFSGYVDFHIYRVEIGNYWIRFSSETVSGYESNSVLLPFQIVRLNKPPIISNLFAPDTVSLSQLTQFRINLKVIDPDGQSDIKSVSRFTPSAKILPLHAYNDSIYYEDVVLNTNPPPQVGPYVFRFRAVDLSYDSSNVLFKTIVVIN